MKRNAKITLGVILCFIGVCLLFSTYFMTLKHEVFNDYNEALYEETLKLSQNVEIINEEETTTSAVLTEPITTTNETVITSKENYIGTIRIDKINLKRGFYDINSKKNNVDKNIFVHETSTFPDQSNNNLILLAHSGSSSISYFKNLYKLDLGDEVIINYNNKDYNYKIKNIYTILKDGTAVIKRNKDKSTLVLITCTKNDKTTQTVYICELD